MKHGPDESNACIKRLAPIMFDIWHTSQFGLDSIDMSHHVNIKAILRRAPELRRDALARYARGVVVRFRRAHEAHRDARLVFRAAAEGRPLELQKRLVLGKLAGGREWQGELDGVMMTPLDAARAGGHGECIKALEDSLGPVDTMSASNSSSVIEQVCLGKLHHFVVPYLENKLVQV